MADVRRLGPHDVEAARELTERYGDPEAGAGDLTAWLADDAHVMIGAHVDGAPAGMAYGYRLPRPDARPAMLLLFSIDVGERFRRQGLGTDLLRAFRAEAPGDVWLLTNESNAAAMALYHGAGGQRPHTDDAMFRFPAGF